MTELKPINEILPESQKGRRKGQITSDELPLTVREELVLSIVELGVSLRKAEYLVNRYPESRIRRQLAWLPKRGARRPASLLIASIERDFDAPAYTE